jgi:hypothetical protein
MESRGKAALAGAALLAGLRNGVYRPVLRGGRAERPAGGRRVRPPSAIPPGTKHPEYAKSCGRE